MSPGHDGEEDWRHGDDRGRRVLTCVPQFTCQADIVEPIPVTFEQNKRWISSAWIGIRIPPWVASLSLVRALKPGVKMIGDGIVFMVLISDVWLFSHVVYLAGLAGCLCEVKPDEKPQQK